MSTKTWTIEKCPCGHEACNDYHIPQLGMVQGGMLDLETATFIVRACNAHDDLVAVLERICAMSEAGANALISPEHHLLSTEIHYVAASALAKAKGE